MEKDIEEAVPINVVLIGDGYVGKTSILKALGKSEANFQEATSANFDGEIEIEKTINDKKVHFKLFDTAGQEEYDYARKAYYEKVANIFLLCFCVADKVSYENVLARWILEIQPYRHTPVILVGTKLDLRIPNSADSVNRVRGIALQKKIGAKFYVECSAVTKQGINDIIDFATQTLTSRSQKSKSFCLLQ